MQGSESEPEKRKWYQTKRTLVIALLTVGPFALPLLWFNPRYTLTAKILWTVLLVGLTYALGAFTTLLFKILMEQLGFPQ